jgi:hypothetical protein
MPTNRIAVAIATGETGRSKRAPATCVTAILNDSSIHNSEACAYVTEI